MSDAIAVIDLVVVRGKSTVLNGLSCTSRPAGSPDLLGPSGAGKTTLISAVVGVQLVRSGTVTCWAGPPAPANCGRGRLRTQAPPSTPI